MNSKNLCWSARFVSIAALILSALTLNAQRPGQNGGAPMGAQMNVGRFYGKIIDANTGGPVEYASVQIRGMRFDSVAKTMKEAIVGGQLTESNGEFNIEGLPIVGEFTLRLTCIGYEELEQKISFGITREMMRNGGGNRAELISKANKDLGNIKMKVSEAVLKTVEINSEAVGYSLALDKKVFKVDKNNLAGGGTAEEALKTIPSLSVDLDGNLSLRNSAPQLFVDGRPTNLTLDQIPADAIDNVEVITNPSAKYDASGAGAGIVNIVLKKERRIGYSGSVRAGIDMRGRPNIGGDINAREGKFNAFLSGNLFMRRSLIETQTDRNNLFANLPTVHVFQKGNTEHNRLFSNERLGLDWFINNRNTLTFAGNYTTGRFKPTDDLSSVSDTLYGDELTHQQQTQRHSETWRRFNNYGGQILYKKLFIREGRELTADINYNGASFVNGGDFETDTLIPAVSLPYLQQQEGKGYNNYFTFQSDFVTPLNKGLKLETGIRAAIRDFSSDNLNYDFNHAQQTWVRRASVADLYRFNDHVYAAYGTFSQSFARWGYQLGLRVESSNYTGTLSESGQTFTKTYPLAAFPSLFTTWKLNEMDNLQFNITRRINRPNFFQLMPFTDLTDVLVLQRGNPDLSPEFMHSAEISYQNVFNAKHNVLISVYGRYAKDLITRYQFSEYNEVLGQDAIVTSYQNANASQAFGTEFTSKNTVLKIVELVSNVNLFYSIVDASNVEANLRNEQFSWLAKENINVKLPRNFTFQLSGEYSSPTSFVSSNDAGGGGGRGGHGGGGGGPHGGPVNTAQGYRLPVWFVDASLKWTFWERKASLTLSMEDLFASRKQGSYTENASFTQETWRLRDPQLVRLNFSYRFGKFDTSLFKRKNDRVESNDTGF